MAIFKVKVSNIKYEPTAFLLNPLKRHKGDKRQDSFFEDSTDRWCQSVRVKMWDN